MSAPEEIEPPADKPQVKSVWPKMNKNDSLQEYFAQLTPSEYIVNTAVIDEVICLTCDEWDEFRENLLTNRYWLKGKGGCYGRGVLSTLAVCHAVDAEKTVAVLVDPQGYDYARYVGFYMNDQHVITGDIPGLPKLAEMMETTLHGVKFADRVLRKG